MDGDFEVDDLGGLLAVATANAHNIEARSAARGGPRRPFGGVAGAGAALALAALALLLLRSRLNRPACPAMPLPSRRRAAA